MYVFVWGRGSIVRLKQNAGIWRQLSTGSDGIHTTFVQLLKEAGPGIVGPLTTLFNRSISLGQVLDEWKHAIVSPICKGGRKDKRSPTNYRPISLTSCVAWTMEKLLHCQVLEYLQTNGLLYEHQGRFLPNHSTVTGRSDHLPVVVQSAPHFCSLMCAMVHHTLIQ